jgi:hypothetical protein
MAELTGIAGVEKPSSEPEVKGALSSEPAPSRDRDERER